MSLLRTSDLEEMTGFSQRYWQKRIANGEVPGAEEMQCGTGRRFLIDSAKFEARGATIFEVNTCRHSATLSERDGMIQDAIEHITSAGRAAASQKNGEKSRGRAPDVIDEGERKRALAVWHDVRFVSNAQAIAAGPKGWTHYRYNKLFGPSGRGQ